MRIGHFLGVVPALLVACAVERPTPPSTFGSDAPPIQGEVARKARVLDLGPVVRATVPPPPLVGGTLAVAKVGGREVAVASDTDRDRVLMFDLDHHALLAEVALGAGDEPGRVAIDSHGLAHVVLRRAGAVVSIDVGSGKVVHRRDVCASPRGIAYATATDLVHVACAGGDLVSFAPLRTDEARRLALTPDLRDVVVDGSQLLVSHFRSVEVDVVSAKGVFQRKLTPTTVIASKPSGADGTFEPEVAWRMIGLPGGGAIVAHQRALSASIDLDPHATPTQTAAYGLGGCSAAVVHSALTFVRGGASTLTLPPILMAALPVDVAVSPAGDRFALVLAGNQGAQQVRVLTTGDLASLDGNGCQGTGSEALMAGWGGKVVSAAFTPSDHLVLQTREPAGIVFDGDVVTVPGRSVDDTGHKLFHMDPGVGIACASCHPEGGEDGRVWRFEHVGARRTPALHGGILDTAPFHWAGDLPDFRALVSDVFVGRMGGLQPEAPHVDALSAWVDTISAPPVAAIADGGAVARGRDVFTRPEVGCASCHSGAKLTNNQTVDVGTGAAFQVPSLRGLSSRAPFLHDGCAATIADRFGPCGGGARHGNVSGLSPSQMDDLITYLGSLLARDAPPKRRRRLG